MPKLKPFKKRGKFIVVYGANNLGKTTQVNLLANKIIAAYKQVLLVKYPIYTIPSGIKIYKILHDNNRKKINYEKFQALYAKNRRDFQDILINILNSNIHVIAEDYTGTGIAWGMTRGVSFPKLRQINSNLIKPDLAILLDGKRFSAGIEKGHINESDEQSIWEQNRKIHLFLAKKYHWEILNANNKIPLISEEIWSLCQHVLIN